MTYKEELRDKFAAEAIAGLTHVALPPSPRPGGKYDAERFVECTEYSKKPASATVLFTGGAISIRRCFTVRCVSAASYIPSRCLWSTRSKLAVWLSP